MKVEASEEIRMERKNGNITTLMLGASTCSENRVSRLIPHLRQATIMGFSAMTLLILASTAQGGTISFAAPGAPGGTSTNITDYGVTPIVFGSNSWQTTNDGIGCVVFPSTAPGNVCGSGRFSGTGFITDPGPVPGGGNYVLVDGAPGPVGTKNKDTLYYSVGGLTAGQQYVVTFAQAAVQFVDSGHGPTTEQWLVSLDAGYISGGIGSNPLTPVGLCDPTVVQLFSGCSSQQAPPMSAPGCVGTCSAGSSLTDYQPWAMRSLTFTASGPTDLLGFFAEGAPGGDPPIDLLGNVSITATPEPETFALLGGALLGVGIARRQAKKRASS
jgi:hypothetical protein